MGQPIAPPESQPERRKHRAKGYAQAVAFQAQLADAAGLCHADMRNVQDSEIRARIGSALASMVRGWDILEERKRILRGRPLPGHLRPDLPASQRKPTRKVALLAQIIEEPKESPLPVDPSPVPPPQGAPD